MSARLPPVACLSAAIAAVSWLGCAPERATACPLTITAGDDVIECTSGTAGDLVDLQGNNSLIFPSGNGSVQSVTYGAGNDLIEMNTCGEVLDMALGGSRWDELGQSGRWCDRPSPVRVSEKGQPRNQCQISAKK